MDQLNSNWHPASWQSKPIKHQPSYADQDKLQAVVSEIAKCPPLVFAGEVESLKGKIAAAAAGEQFLLQGGDCAERFQDCHPEAITRKIKILLQMSVILTYGGRRPIIRVGRIAGQFAKPRSSDWQTLADGSKIPIFRGDIINSFHADEQARQPDPMRMLNAFHVSSMTLNYIRAMIAGGFADLNHPENWDLGFIDQVQHKTRYENVVANIKDAISFMESLGGVTQSALGRIDFYTSHEALLLKYEQALTRHDATHDKHYNLGAHMLWVGDRTRQLDGAHIEYLRGIANPIGIKWGPSADPDEMVNVLKYLNPENEAGKIVIITRFGCKNVEDALPEAVAKVQEAGLNVLWSSDPMHGNTRTTSQGIKTRDFKDILAELELVLATHKRCGSRLGGVHFELTGDEVTECTGGASGLQDEDLAAQYESFCDPRLNYSQSLEIAFLIATMIKSHT